MELCGPQPVIICSEVNVLCNVQQVYSVVVIRIYMVQLRWTVDSHSCTVVAVATMAWASVVRFWQL